MEDCNAKLAGQFTRVCGTKPKQGVAEKWYGNWDDVDRVATQYANRNTTVSALVLKNGSKIYKAQGNDKSHKIKHALAVGDYGNGYIHTDEFIPMYRGANENERVQEFAEGARIFSIEKMVDTGKNGETTYKVAGLESGMLITNDDYDSSANSGTSTIILATKEGEEEATGLKLFIMSGGVDAVDAWITANTYVPPVPDPDEGG